MADKNAEVAVEDNGGMKKTLSLWNFFTIGFGAIIGTGWVLQVGDWMVVGGGPVPAMIAFLLGAIFLVPVGAVFGELTAAIPISGGIVEYVDRSFGRTLSYITGWLLALGNGILCPWEAIAISTLVSEMFGSLPGLEWLRAVKLYTILGADVYLFPTLIALGFAVYVIFLNFRGASSAAKLQAFLTKALLCGMLLAMGVSLFTGSPDNAMPVFSQVAGAGGGKAATESTSLFAGIVSVLVLTPFFYAGFDTIPQQAEEAAEGLNWNKFGKIISLALLAAGGFYMVCIYSFGTILDWHEFVKSPVPALACLKGINMLLYLAMLVIATLGPMGPMNSFYGATSRIMLAIKTILSGAGGIETLIFDEIDTGIGGLVLTTVADKLEALGQHEQVICVTHAPSIAARGDRNFFIEKQAVNDLTETHVALLDSEDALVREIARMSGGTDPWQLEAAARLRAQKHFH